MGAVVQRSKIIEIVILGLWLMLAVTFFVKYRYQNKELPLVNEPVVKETESLKSGKEFSVRRITVIDGSTFDLLLKDEDSTRVLCELDVKATGDAKLKVLDFLNSSQRPQVKLIRRQENGKWLVDLTINESDKQISLSSWLKENKLVYR